MVIWEKVSVTLVALLAEGVDRNDLGVHTVHCVAVALLAEGVDRNWHLLIHLWSCRGRPPRGGRG